MVLLPRLLLALVIFWLPLERGRAAPPPATEADDIQELALIEDERIRETSGIAASVRFPGCIWLHNDSGDEPQLFLVETSSGQVCTRVRLRGATHVDWEGISLAPGKSADEWDVCVADVGDNQAQRRELTLYRFSETALERPARPEVQIEPRRYRIRYVDGPRDVEGFAVHPRLNLAYFFSKRSDGACDVLRLDTWDESAVGECRSVGRLRFPPLAPLETMVTAADFSADGRALATRSYLAVWEWRLAAGATPDSAAALEPLFQTEPRRLQPAAEPQGEAICYTRDARFILSVSELRQPAINRLPLPRRAQPVAPRP